MPTIPASTLTKPYPTRIKLSTIEVEACIGKQAINEDRAKKMLGWMESDRPDSENWMPRDIEGHFIQFEHNTKNRQLSETWCRTLAQDILGKNWVLNGETIIVGRSKQILSGQHRLIGLVLACQLWRRNPHQWKANWPTPPTIESIIVFNVEEDARHVRTLDNVKPRNLADVLFTSELLQDYNQAARRSMSRITDYAIRMLWSRTGAANAFTPYRTHSESIDFIGRHPRIIECVKHIYDNNSSKGIGNYLSPGYAAGLMYLMGSSATDGRKYWLGKPPQEDLLNLDRWDQATEFWSEFSAGDSLKAVRKALDKLSSEEVDGVGYEESIALIIKAWLLYVEGMPIKTAIELHYITDEEGIRRLGEKPLIGGIDCGGPQNSSHTLADDGEDDDA